MEYPPDPGPGEVLVRIRAVGICGSDMHLYSEGGVAGSPARYPMVLGHEPGGEIAAVGPGVESLKEGVRVAVEPAILRRPCELAREGRRHLSENIVFMGGVQIPGALREYAVVPEQNCIPAPEDLSLIDAAFVEPVAVLLHSIELAELRLGETVAVTGAGPIGLLAVALAKRAGASRIVVTDRVPHRLQKALELGADAAVDVSKDSPKEAVRDLMGLGAHVVFDAAGKPESINDGLRCLRPGGRMVIIGIPSQTPVGVDLWQAMGKEATIRVQKRSNGNDEAAMQLIREGAVRSDWIVTHRVPFEQGHRAFEMMANYSDGVIKPVVEFG